MAYLGKYIRQILSRQEPVILPGFGSLVISESKGGKGERGTIEPPGPVIRFDATHPKGDGKLAIEYAAGEHIEPEEARQQVLELVDAIKFKLDKGEKYKLELVGEFSRDDNNKVHFRKDPNWVIDPELFGLSELDLLELDAEEEPEATIAPQISDQEPPGKSKEKVPVTDPVAPQKMSVRNVQRKPVNKWKIIWIVAGALIAVLILILMIPGGNGVEFGKDGIVIRDDPGSKAATTADKSDDPGSKAATAPDKSDDPGVKEEQDHAAEPVATASEEPQQQQVPETENRYFIIAGSFKNLPNATHLMDELKAEGFPAEIIITENRLYRVSIKSYSKKEAAIGELEKVRNASGKTSAWVLTR